MDNDRYDGGYICRCSWQQLPGSWSVEPDLLPVLITVDHSGTSDGSDESDDAKPWLVYVHEGHRDPFDQSSFEFAYTFDGRSGCGRGKLTDDDRVTYEVQEKDGRWESVGDHCLLPSLTAK